MEAASRSHLSEALNQECSTAIFSRYGRRKWHICCVCREVGDTTESSTLNSPACELEFRMRSYKTTGRGKCSEWTHTNSEWTNTNYSCITLMSCLQAVTKATLVLHLGGRLSLLSMKCLMAAKSYTNPIRKLRHHSTHKEMNAIMKQFTDS